MADRRVTGIIYNERLPEARMLTERLQRKLERSRSCWTCAASEVERFHNTMRETSIAITVGGDGTILRTVRIAAPYEVPIVGVNLGRVGFMTELSANQALDRIDFYLDGRAWVEERTMIEGRVISGETEPLSEKDVLPTFHGLNDVVVGSSSVARLVFISVTVDGSHLTTYATDAIIIATATGSTGYALSVGGPIIHPQEANLLLKPVAPHLTLGAAIVLHPEAVVTLRLESDTKATVSVDGFVNLPMKPGDMVEAKKSPYVARFLRAGSASYFYETLLARLRAGQESPATSAISLSTSQG